MRVAAGVRPQAGDKAVCALLPVHIEGSGGASRTSWETPARLPRSIFA
jgi:hypothetical protein